MNKAPSVSEKENGGIPQKAPAMIDKRIHDLGVVINANLASIFLPSEDWDYHLAHKDRMRETLRRGLTRRKFYSAREVNINHELRLAAAYAFDRLDCLAPLYEEFEIPEAFPWKTVTAVYIPASTSWKDAIRALCEFVPVETRIDTNWRLPAKDRLLFVDGRVKPSEETEGLSAPELRQLGYYTYLDLTGLLVAYGVNIAGHAKDKNLRHFLNCSLIWAPENILPDGRTAAISGVISSDAVDVTAHGPAYRPNTGGAVLAIEARVKT